jgi:hypothetical protein
VRCFLPFQPLQGGKKEFGNLKRYVNILFSSYMCDCAYSPDTQEEFFAKKEKKLSVICLPHDYKVSLNISNTAPLKSSSLLL